MVKKRILDVESKEERSKNIDKKKRPERTGLKQKFQTYMTLILRKSSVQKWEWFMVV